MKKGVKTTVFSCLFVGALFCGLKISGLNFIAVNGNSMESSIMDGSIIFYLEGAFEIHSGDIVLLDMNFDGKRQLIIKRVVGIAGDTISSRHGQLYVNGKRLKEGYASGRTDCEDLVVPDGSIFVLGDNRNSSYDSREFGTVKVNKIAGKVL